MTATRPGADTGTAAAPAGRAPRRVERRTRWGEIAVSVVILFALLLLVRSLAVNPRLSWDVVARYLFDPTILRGLRLTLMLAVGCMLLAIVVGLASALMGISRSPVLRAVSTGYVWIFRGTPVLVQLIIWFNLALLFPVISIGIPFGPEFASWRTNDLITPIIAAVIGFTLAEGAFMSEIIRSGIQAVDGGQREAAQSLGMTGRQTMRRIVLPQAVRVIIPPTGNEFITMLKGTALAAVIAVPELLHMGQRVYHANYQVIELLLVVSIWYLVVVSIATVNQYFLERYYARRS
jgi:polar amino acid transport system permease protein